MRLPELGASVVAADGARSVVDHAFGRRPEPLAPELARRLAIAHAEVLEHVAFGRNADALAEADPILEAGDA